MRALRLVASALLLLAGCAEPRKAVVTQRAPAAARPALLAIAHTQARPTRASGELAFGEARELRACAFDRQVATLPPDGGLLLRFQAPVPTDLRLQIDTSLGQQRVAAPEDTDDEERLFRRGSAYFHENQALARAAPTGSVAMRELVLWPGSAALRDRRVDLELRSVSFDPAATGEDRESPPLVLSLVGRCPDLAISLSREELSLTQGSARRVVVQVIPSGDGVREMRTALSLEGLPKGVTAAVTAPVVNETNWTAPRQSAIDLTAEADAPPGAARVAIKVVLGGVERRAAVALRVVKRPDL